MRYVYDFDEPCEGGRELLGGKGIGLAEMTQLGVPVPAGFTITTEACRAYMRAGGRLPDGLRRRGRASTSGALEEKAGKRFGDRHDPLLVSVRSGAAISMPGMMDTILNVGLDDESVEGLAETTGQPPLRVRLVPAPDPDVRRDRRRRSTATGSSRSSRTLKQRARRRAGRRPHRRRPRRAGRPVQGDLRGGDRPAVPAGRARAARAARSRPSSSRGTRRAPRSTGARTRSPTTSARR